MFVWLCSLFFIAAHLQTLGGTVTNNILLRVYFIVLMLLETTTFDSLLQVKTS